MCSLARLQGLHPVADHRYVPVLRGQPTNLFDLLIRLQIGKDIINANFLGYRASGPCVVAGQHHDSPHAGVTKGLGARHERLRADCHESQ